MRICLNTIAKNEGARIERMLASVVPHIACVVVVDTGSTDDTVQKITDFCKSRSIPCEIRLVPFENFEQSRNAALRLAQNSSFAFDAILLVDCDMELVVDRADWLDGASGPSYTMRQVSGGLSYSNTRLVSRHVPAEYIGVTHEYLSVDHAGSLDGAYFIDHADGANRPDKFKRDIALLKHALKNKPSETLRGRYLFYLAQSYRDAGKFRPAIITYRERIALGGWDEELFFAQYSIAQCYRSLGNVPQYLSGLLAAYSMRPSRVEPLYDLANYFRIEGQNAVSLLFSEPAMKMPMTGDHLFVNTHAYDLGPKEEFSICAFYVPDKREAGFSACNELSLSSKASPGMRDLARNNIYHYLPTLAERVPYVSHHRLALVTEPGWTPLNPCVMNTTQGLKCLIRTVNYVITDEGYYMINGKDGRIHFSDENPIDTRNFLVDVGNDYVVRNPKEVIYPARAHPPAWGAVRGFEDMRIFPLGSELWSSSTVRELHSGGNCEQVVARLIPEDGYYSIDSIRRMLGTGRSTEKNWMPLISRTGNHEISLDGMRWVYRLGVLVNAKGETTDSNPPAGIDIEALSGGSQMVEVSPGVYLGVVHEARPLNGDYSKRYYWHRFVVTNSSGGFIAITKPFVFQGKQIEFAAGLALRGKEVIVSYGVRDREAWLAVLDLQDVMGMFVDGS